MDRPGRRGVRRAWRWTLGLVLAVLALAACAEPYVPIGPFEPKRDNPPPAVGPPPESSVPGVPGEPGEPSEDGEDPNVVATGLTLPTGLAPLPDGSALVGERTTGRILQVYPPMAELPPVERMVVPGIDASGDGGLLGLAVSPSYPQDGLVYAYLTTAEDNRVVKFSIGGTPNPVFTGIPKGPVHNGGGLAFGVDGLLYAGTGDAGQPQLALDGTSLAGKTLRFDVFGQPAGIGAIFTRGHSDVAAICPGPDGSVFATDRIDAVPDELNALVEDGTYGHPEPRSDSVDPVLESVPPVDGLTGCARSDTGALVASLDGQRIVGTELDEELVPVGDPLEVLTERYGRLRTIVLDAMGGLWVTTSNRDGIGVPTPEDDRVIYIQAPSTGGGGGSPA